ncbi:PQQ-binding-like beta-propeller repeat protein [Thalassotalea fonticola]|uniref:PQQ-binding-like beta-propeller repeat protein n=1 Tax=Thalassotalea fonticola TaxID=3065649 RepID=A0ABZ0GIV0_9GAMM|nr:PQQ-binding-like beta-propeller repeat protein [Colwelliaceae bacterium S1-1]
MQILTPLFRNIFIVLAFLSLFSCGGSGGNEDSGGSSNENILEISGVPNASVVENSEYIFQPVLNSSNQTGIQFSIQKLPSWATFDSATGILSGTPTYNDAGVYADILISVSDGSNNKSLSVFSIEVINVNRLPSLTSLPSIELMETEELVYTVQISDKDNDPVEVNANNLPSWVSFDSESLQLLIQPGLADAGLYPDISITLNDGFEEVTQMLSITVENAITISGKVMDGYIQGALVYVDTNLNKVFDENEIHSYSDKDGSYVLFYPESKLSILKSVPIRAYLGEGAIDESRIEVNYKDTPITISRMPFVDTTSTNDAIANVIISPFTDSIEKGIAHLIEQFYANEINLNELKGAILAEQERLANEVKNELEVDFEQLEISFESFVAVLVGDFIDDTLIGQQMIVLAEELLDAIILLEDVRDSDNDGLVNNVDDDDDNDGVLDEDDTFPLDSTESIDTDLDGLGNNIDGDDDNDGVLDESDVFPLDGAESADTDMDGVGDNADFYQTDASCSAESDGNGTACYLTWLAAQQLNHISYSDAGNIYFYTDSSALLLNFNIESQSFESVTSTAGVTDIEYSEAHQRLYVGYASGEIKYLNDEFTLNHHAQLDNCVSSLIDAGTYLVARECNGYSYGVYKSINTYGDIIAQSQDYYDTSIYTQWNNSLSRLYHFRDGISPNDIISTQINSDGSFVRSDDSPYHGAYSITGPISISYDDSLVLLGSGDIYNADGLSWFGSINTGFDFAFWQVDNSLVTLHISGSTTTLYRRDSEFRVVETVRIEGIVQEVIADGDNASIVLKQAAKLKVYSYIPSSDSDEDGVSNLEDAFPQDIAASVDSDNDGYPDAWNEGKSQLDSSSNLTIDAFPTDSACWLDSHGIDGVCDYGATVPNFVPDVIVADDSGDIYLLSQANNKIYRWLSDSQRYGNPIFVGQSTAVHSLAPTHMAFSSSHQRIYLGYGNGKISYVALADLSAEVDFANTAMPVGGLASVGNFVLAQDGSGAWNTHYIFDRNGQLTDQEDWNRRSQTYAWNSHTSKVYFLRDGTSPNDLHYEEINQVIGTIGAEGDSPYHSSTGIRHPVRVSHDRRHIILGSGSIYDANDLSLVGDLNIAGVDVQWMSNVILTIEDSLNATQLKFWHSSEYTLMGSVTINGTPLKIVQHNDDAIIISKTGSGLSFTKKVIADHDLDTLPGWWEELNQLNDNDSSDAPLDSDNDGLTNLQEFNLLTDPQNSDSDNDGINDGDEVNTYGTQPLDADSDDDGLNDGEEVNTYFTQPLNSDSDSDGLTDEQEVNVYLSNPLNSDSDNDGLADNFEVDNQLNPNVDDAQLDADSDGLDNIGEFTAGSNINKADTDNDGLSDGEEVHTYLTDPTNRDTDADKLPDGWEINFAFNPLLATDATTDFDNDSFDNLTEFFLQSDPTDINSIPVAQPWSGHQGNAAHNGFTALTINSDNLAVRWSISMPAGFDNFNPVTAINGQVFATNYTWYDDEAVYALDAVDGSVLWHKAFTDAGFVNAPTVDNGSVYLQTGTSGDSYLYSFDTNNGELNYKVSYGNQSTRYKAPTVYEQEVYTGGGRYGGSYKYNAINGEELWFTDLAQCGNWTPAVDDEYFYYFSTGFTKADKETGEQVSVFGDSSWRCLTPVLGGQNDAFAIADYSLVAFDLANDNIKWQHNEEGLSSNRFTGEPAVGLGKVYAIKNGSLTVYDQFSGEQLWTWQPLNNNSLSGNLALTNNVLFIGDGTNTYAVDITTHQQVWSYPAFGHISLSLEGALYIAKSTGQLIAINYGNDSDEDGMDDWWEDRFGFDKDSAADAELDADSDGLSNLEEFNLGTTPTNTDTDGDQLSDYDEHLTYLSNPKNADSDDDGMDDGWEVTQGFDLLNPADGMTDSDADGILNVEEYIEGTDPWDETSLPDIVTSMDISFEDGVLTDNWVIDQTMPSSWAVDNLSASHGEYSLFSSNDAAIEYSDFFHGNLMSFDINANCNSSFRYYLYIDGVYENSAYLSYGWQNVEVLIPRGRHTIRFEIDESCGGRIDNIQFSALSNTIEDEVNYVGTFGSKLRFYDYDDNLIKEAPITDFQHDTRGVSVLSNGKVAVFNNYSNSNLSIYTPEYHLWQHYSLPNWGGNGIFDGIETIGDYIFLIDSLNDSTNGRGIIRFNLNTEQYNHYSGGSYQDLAVGENNKLYALIGSQINVYAPETMTLERTIAVGAVSLFDVDSAGNIYVGSSQRQLRKLDSNGVQIGTLDINNFYIENSMSAGSFKNIELNARNEVLITDSYERVLKADFDSDTIALVQGDNSLDRISVAPLIDDDLDGMPLWWENKYGLSDADSSDAQLDLDSDGLTNLAEYTEKTAANNSDTDADLLSDFDEITTYGTNPLKIDSDGDQLSDGDEVNNHFTDPLDTDSDDDGFADNSELVLYNTDPNDADSVPDAIDYFADNFDSGDISTVWQTTASSNAQWFIEEGVLRSGDIDDREQSIIQIEGLFAQGTFSFDASVSSESCCDSLEVYVDDVRQLATVNAETQTYELQLDSGQHVIKFRYEKDGSVSRGTDSAYIDNIEFVSINHNPLSSYSESFDLAAIPEAFIHPDDSDANWNVISYLEGEVGIGDWVLASGTISDSLQSVIEFEESFVSGTFSFMAKVDSENCCDNLFVYLNDVLVVDSVTETWQQYSFDITEGAHKIKFVYSKNDSISVGDDKAYIDDLSFIAN